MNKTLLVVQREYMTRVKKKSFLLTTILVPIVIIGFYIAIIAVSIGGSSDSNKIAVIDEGSLFNNKIEKANGDKSEYTIITDQGEESFKAAYKSKGYEYFLYISSLDSTQRPDSVQLFSTSPISLSIKSDIEKTINKAIEAKRLQLAKISSDQYRSIRSDISINNRISTEDGDEKESVTGVATIVAFASGILIYMILLIYGTMVMRGVMEEKTSRIAEVIVSSVKPFQLMLGKILGIGAVGLTQFAIWIVLIIGMQFLLPLFMPGMASQVTEQAAGVGAAAQDPSMLQKFTQVFPVMMPIILAFVIMMRAVSEPNSSLAVFGSLFPLTSPVVMMGRIVFGVPISELIISMVLLIISFLFFTWLTAKIYRTGILLYGKKVTWKEMIKWAFRRS